MIISFRHKGLEKFYRTGSKAGIQAAHAAKLNLILTALEAADCPQDMDINGWDLHALAGVLKDHWSVKVNANWRITFRFVGADIELVDYQDYH
ncbi:type II toxin-antitoxin system RelE/ParE family toxin [Stenoxybacter acetivorans]|uniref:type II toxin-antitoxin system RelE/ParE family toxin n=1 Tax=Stenoxybacter acetivorans TaxID=422441 RepID=UPI00055AA91D|nr:type II toxin-antitoxin system RelE/ParE family toxin [Stenoxybacter acetivorans]